MEIAVNGYWKAVGRVFGFAGFGKEGLSFLTGLEVAQVEEGLIGLDWVMGYQYLAVSAFQCVSSVELYQTQF